MKNSRIIMYQLVCIAGICHISYVFCDPGLSSRMRSCIESSYDEPVGFVIDEIVDMAGRDLDKAAFLATVAAPTEVLAGGEEEFAGERGAFLWMSSMAIVSPEPHRPLPVLLENADSPRDIAGKRDDTELAAILAIASSGALLRRVSSDCSVTPIEGSVSRSSRLLRRFGSQESLCSLTPVDHGATPMEEAAHHPVTPMTPGDARGAFLNPMGRTPLAREGDLPSPRRMRRQKSYEKVVKTSGGVLSPVAELATPPMTGEVGDSRSVSPFGL